MKITTFLATLLVAMMSFAQVPTYVPTTGLVGWWPFNGNANDESGNGLNGTINGASLITDRFGLPNQAFSFNVNQNIIINNTTTLNPFPLTISLWYKATNWSPGENSNIIKKYSSGAWNGFGISLNDYNNVPCVPSFYLRSTSNRILGYYNEPAFDQTNITLSQWYHYVFVVDSFGGHIYVDGNLISNHPWTGSNGPTNSNLLLQIGGLADTWFRGLIDDIGIWNRALTQCEIQDLYHSQLGYTTVNAGNNQTVCNGNQITLSATGASTYSWNNNVTNDQPFTPTSTQDYIVTGTDSLGCTGTDTVSVVVLESTAATQTETALDTYTWPLNNQVYSQSGTYTDTIPNAAGCDSIVTLNLTLNYTGINELNQSKLVISPNPTKDVFTISGLEQLGILNSLALKDVNGKVVKVLDPTATELNTTDLKAGIYFLEVNAGTTHEVIKLVKE